MTILPIRHVREDDGPFVGKNLVNLGKLAQDDLPVANGIVVIPPHIKLKTVLEHFKFSDKERFEQSLEILKKEVHKIPIPEDLEKEVKGKRIDVKKLWLGLLETWLEEIRSRIWREGFYPGLTDNLTAQPVFFTDKILATFEAYFDSSMKNSVIKTTFGQVSEEDKMKVDEIVKRADKKIFFPQIYHFIFDSKVKIVKVVPFTQATKLEEKIIIKETILNPERIIQTSTKIFLNINGATGLKTARNVNGAIISAQDILEHELKVATFAEVASDFSPNPVIYKLADVGEKHGGVRGALKLIHSGELLKKEVEIFLFARHKKSLINTQIAVPFVRNINEFLQIKRDLASLGISRKGTLKLWVELAVPENFLNLEEYILAGFDGAIINLDELAAWLGGFDPKQPESVFYMKQVTALINFLETGFKILHKARIPIIIIGSLSLHEDILPEFLGKGIWGISVDIANTEHTRDQVAFFEHHHLKHRLVN